MSKEIRFKLLFNDGTIDREVGVLPFVLTKSSISEEQESDQVFFRKTFPSIALRSYGFTGLQQYVKNSPLTRSFTLVQERRSGGSFVEQWRGEFFKTDCRFDDDQGRLIVKPPTLDQYTNIMAGLDREFNVLDMGIARTTTNFKIRSSLQLYQLGDEYLTNVISGGVHWQQPVNNSSITPAELTDLFFNSSAEKYFIPVEPVGAPLPVGGNWTYNIGLNQYTNGIMTMDWFPGLNRWKIQQFGLDEYIGTEFETNEFESVFVPVGLGPDVKIYKRRIYVRLITAATVVDGTPTEPIPMDDIVPANNNYGFVLPVQTENFVLSDDIDLAPDIYGRPDANGLNIDGSEYYFHRPAMPGGEQSFPLSRPSWSGLSVWFYLDNDVRDLFVDSDVFRTVKDGYLLEDVIAALLAEIDPNVTFLPDTDHSEFYFDVNPIDGTENKIVFIPKSNILIGEYDQPAQKEIITLKDVLNFCWTAHRNKWFVDSQNRFRLESMYFFDRGGSYTEDVIGVNISDYIEPRSGQPWSIGQNSYSFDKSKLHEAYVLKWMESGSPAFDGFPVEFTDGYVSKGSRPEIIAARFFTDLDFGLISGSELSKNGFFALAKNETDEVEIIEVTVSGFTYQLQNGYLSNFYLHPNFWRHGAGSLNMKINGEVTTALTIVRAIDQKVEFATDVDVNPMELFVTALGTGKISSSDFGITTNSKTISVNHDTE